MTRLLLLLPMALVFGCTRPSGPDVDPAYLELVEASKRRQRAAEGEIDCSSRRIGDVIVLLGPEIDGELERQFIDHGGPEQLRLALLEELGTHRMTNPESPRRLDVGVDRFRLRGSVQGAFGRIFTGNDLIEATVFARCNGVRQRQFPATISSRKPGIESASSRVRFDRMVRALARDIAKQYALQEVLER